MKSIGESVTISWKINKREKERPRVENRAKIKEGSK